MRLWLKLTDTIIKRTDLMFLLPLVRPCLTIKWSLVTSRRYPPNFDGWANLEMEFSNSRLSRRTWTTLSLLEWSAWVRRAPPPLFCVTAASGFPEAVGLLDDLQLPRPCKYSGEASIFRSSPSPKSKSAILSAESQLQWICDWEQDVSAPTFSLSSISSAIGFW